MKIAYLASMYPDISHTFILREVRSLRARGVDVTTFSIRRAGDRNILGTDARQEAASTQWLLPPRAGHLALAFVWACATRPLLSGRTLWDAIGQRGTTVGQRMKWLWYFAEAILLAYWLTARAFHHLHCHFGNNGSSTGMLAARLARIPFSITCHGSELCEIGKHRLAEKVARAAFVVCVSKYGKAQLMLASQPKHWSKLQVVRCGIPCAGNPTGSPPRDNKSAQILCVGRLSPEKGHLVLLDALARLCAQGVDVACTLVGDGPLRSAIEARVEGLDLAKSVTLTGSLEPDRVAERYRSADVVVLASFSEGVPVVLMEAMACGCPVVATHVGGVPELIEHARSGILVAPGDADALANALRAILDNPERAATMGQIGARRVREEFNTETSADQLVKLFGSSHRFRTGGPQRTNCEQTPWPVKLTHQDF